MRARTTLTWRTIPVRASEAARMWRPAFADKATRGRAIHRKQVSA